MSRSIRTATSARVRRDLGELVARQADASAADMDMVFDKIVPESLPYRHSEFSASACLDAWGAPSACSARDVAAARLATSLLLGSRHGCCWQEPCSSAFRARPVLCRAIDATHASLCASPVLSLMPLPSSSRRRTRRLGLALEGHALGLEHHRADLQRQVGARHLAGESSAAAFLAAAARRGEATPADRGAMRSS